MDSPRLRLLDDKVVLITGAAGGFGTGLAETLAGHGARLALLDLDADGVAAIAERIGGSAIPLAADLRDERAIERAVNGAVERFGRIDALVNNAAVLRERALDAATGTDWDDMVAVNMRGTWSISRVVGSRMADAGGGSIVNITSIAAYTASPYCGVYSMTKAALRSLTQQIAVEWGPQNIRCNSLYIGGVGWGMKGMKKVDPQAEGLPLGRLGHMEEFANAVAFLASDLASYVSGAELAVDGARSLTLLGARHAPADAAPPFGGAAP